MSGRRFRPPPPRGTARGKRGRSPAARSLLGRARRWYHPRSRPHRPVAARSSAPDRRGLRLLRPLPRDLRGGSPTVRAWSDARPGRVRWAPQHRHEPVGRRCGGARERRLQRREPDPPTARAPVRPAARAGAGTRRVPPRQVGRLVPDRGRGTGAERILVLRHGGPAREPGRACVADRPLPEPPARPGLVRLRHGAGALGAVR